MEKNRNCVCIEHMANKINNREGNHRTFLNIACIAATNEHGGNSPAFTSVIYIIYTHNFIYTHNYNHNY